MSDVSACFVTEDLAHLGLMLGRFLVMAQAAFLDRQFFDLLPPCNDGRVTPEVDIGGRNVAKALVVAMVAIEKLHGTKVNKNKIRVKPAK